MFSYFANPTRFLKLKRVLLPLSVLACVVLFPVGLFYALYVSPEDYQQGQIVRIMYIHVPAAWMGLFVYTSMAVAAFMGLVWRHTLAELYVRAASLVGAAFTLICLVTGALWGKPMWGAWWVWDARLTSVLILFFLYLGYMALVDAFDDAEKGVKAGNILVLVGFINVPIIKFSVDWWNTLHQPASVMRLGSPAIDPAMMTPLLLMAGAFMALFIALTLTRLETEMNRRKIRARMLETGENHG